MMKHDRIGWIDAVKGFAIICVVFGHIINGYMSAGLYPEHAVWMRNIIKTVYLFHMPLFFIISGHSYAMAYIRGRIPDSRADSAHLRDRVLNLFLLYTFHSLLFGAAKILFSEYVNKEISVKDVLLVWIRPIQLYWYLYVLIVLYLIFSIDSVRNISRKYLLTILFLVSLFSGFLPNMRTFQVSRLLFHAFFFYVGIQDEEEMETMISRHRRLLLLLFGAAAVLIVMYWPQKKYLHTVPAVNTLIAAGVCGGILLVFAGLKSFRFRSLQLCGRYSLEIYLFHTYVFTLNRTLFQKAGLTDFTLNVALNCMLSVTMPILFSMLMERAGIAELLLQPYYSLRKICGNRKSRQ